MTDQPTDIDQAKQHLEAYVHTQLELAKLHAAERAAQVVASGAISLSATILVFFVLGFLGLALAYYLGELLLGLHWGFLCVSGIYLLLFMLYTTILRPHFHRLYTNNFIKRLFEKHEK